MDVETRETRLGEPRLGNGSTPPSTVPASTRERSEQALWSAAGLLYQRRRLIAGVTAVAAVGSILLALLLPRYYAAEARVLQPEGGALSVLSGLVGGPGGLGGLLGVGGGEYTRYLAILNSDGMKTSVVDAFDLVQVYETDDSETPEFDAMMRLSKNVEFDVDPEFLSLAVRAYDRDPERAARMANFMVERLNEVHTRLTSENAGQTRSFIEIRLAEAEADLDSVRAELQTFQEEHGVVELETQAQVFMEGMAVARASVAETEVAYQTLLSQYGSDNPQVRTAREALRAARGQVQGALSGRDALLPVAMGELPALTRRYAELIQGQLIQAEIIETVYPIYEQARIQEMNETDAVQVLDAAVPPIQPARPSRRFIVIVSTLSGFVLAVSFVLLLAWWRRHYPYVAERLRRAAANADA
ncbi:MAG: lipopolysaccharide biosynthesis protein [Bacteroidota bacterium]